MELLVTLLLIPITCTFFVIATWVVRRCYRHTILKRHGVKGPEPSFFSGNMGELRSGALINDIITSWIEKYGNVFGYYVGETPYVVVNDLEMLKQIFIKDFHKFTNRTELTLDVKPLNKTLIALKDKRWKEVRTILTPTFSSGKIKLMTNIVNKKVDSAVEIVSEKAEKDEMFNMYELVQGLTLDVIADCALAMKTNCQRNYQDALFEAVREYSRVALDKAVMYAIMFPFVAWIMAFVSNYLPAGQMTKLIVENVNRAIAERRKNPEKKSTDILQLMLDHSENDSKDGTGLTDEEIIANAYIFLLAGYETTATALAFTFYLLIKHPDIQEQLYKEIEEVDDSDCNYSTIQSLQYLDQVFCEVLRYHPPVTGFITRASADDYQVGSVTIPKGSMVVAPVWDIHHNPEFWPDPWKFDPERFSLENKSSLNSMAYMPFGIGPRNCIGARFAQLEAKLTIFRLVKNFRFETCEMTDDPLTLVCPTVITYPVNGVWLKAVPRMSGL